MQEFVAKKKKQQRQTNNNWNINIYKQQTCTFRVRDQRYFRTIFDKLGKRKQNRIEKLIKSRFDEESGIQCTCEHTPCNYYHNYALYVIFITQPAVFKSFNGTRRPSMSIKRRKFKWAVS